MKEMHSERPTTTAPSIKTPKGQIRLLKFMTSNAIYEGFLRLMQSCSYLVEEEMITSDEQQCWPFFKQVTFSALQNV